MPRIDPTFLELALIRYGGFALVLAGCALTAYGLITRETVLTRHLRRYTIHLDRQLKLLFLKGSGQRIVTVQLGTAVAFALLSAFLELSFWYALLALIAVVPVVHLSRKRKEHVKKLEQQVDGLILGLANALKTVPSPAAALTQVVPILPVPMRLEVDRVLKEVRLGSTLEQSLLNFSGRLKSPELDTALSSVLIGLQVGGNLPQVLENTGAALREMGRLQGVVRTKTAEGRAQLWVLGLFPFLICFAFKLLDKNYFAPMQESFTGTLVMSIAIGFWIASLITARKILKVDV